MARAKTMIKFVVYVSLFFRIFVIFGCFLSLRSRCCCCWCYYVYCSVHIREACDISQNRNKSYFSLLSLAWIVFLMLAATQQASGCYKMTSLAIDGIEMEKVKRIKEKFLQTNFNIMWRRENRMKSTNSLATKRNGKKHKQIVFIICELLFFGILQLSPLLLLERDNSELYTMGMALITMLVFILTSSRCHSITLFWYIQAKRIRIKFQHLINMKYIWFASGMRWT